MSAPLPAPAPKPRVLLRRTYRAVDAWERRWGRHAGKILLLTTPVALIVLLVGIFLVNGLCIGLSGSDGCHVGFDLYATALIVAAASAAGLSIATLVARLAARLRHRRRRRSARQALEQLQARLGGTDPLQEDRYRQLHEQWTLRPPDGGYRRNATILLTLAALLAPILLAFVLASEDQFDEHGTLFVFEATLEAFRYLLIQVGLVASLVLEIQLVRTYLGTRRLARETWEEFETAVGAAAAELVRKHEQPLTGGADGPGFTFQAYASHRRAAQQNP